MKNKKYKFNKKQDNENEIESLLKHIKELSKYSYDLEKDREDSLLQQSGRMLEAFSVYTATMGILLSVILEYIPSLPKKFIFAATGIISLLLIVSLVLAILAQWRYKYVTLPLPKEIYKHVHDNYKPFLNNINQIKHYNELLNEVQESKKKNNNFRVELIKWSMIFFFFGIIAFIVSAIVAMNIIIFK